MSSIPVINVNTKLKKKAVHKITKFPCNQCEYKATEKGNLKKHIMSKHENVKATTKGSNTPSSIQEIK